MNASIHASQSVSLELSVMLTVGLCASIAPPLVCPLGLAEIARVNFPGGFELFLAYYGFTQKPYNVF